MCARVGHLDQKSTKNIMNINEEEKKQPNFFCNDQLNNFFKPVHQMNERSDIRYILEEKKKTSVCVQWHGFQTILNDGSLFLLLLFSLAIFPNTTLKITVYLRALNLLKNAIQSLVFFFFYILKQTYSDFDHTKYKKKFISK